MDQGDTTASRAFVVGPDEGRSWWQPVPANGFAEARVGPFNVPGCQFASGVQHVAPGGRIREHLHPAHEELICVYEGEGIAVIDDVEHALVPGTTVYLGPNRRHGFINTGSADLAFFWFLMPGGLEGFFAAIGRPRSPGEPAPEPFARPADVLEIERRTVFAPITDDASR